MSEHYTHGRQGQGARRRKNHGRPYRRRMPRQQDTPAPKPSLLQRILGFFGIGRKKKDASGDSHGNQKKNRPQQKVRIAKGRSNQSGNPAARSEHKNNRRKTTSVPPTNSSRLYVGNLSYEATEAELEDLFKGFGNVRSVEIIYNPRTYKSKGYAFVEMAVLDDARRATEVLHGQPFMGRELIVSTASERPENAQKEETAPAPEPEKEEESSC